MPGYISIQFDNGSIEQYAVAQEMANRGMRATFFVNTGYIEWVEDGSWEHWVFSVQDMKNLIVMGHEIGCHSYYHTDGYAISQLGSYYPVGYIMTDADIRTMVSADKANLDRWGITALQGGKVNFAYPSGSRNAHTDQVIGNLGLFRSIASAYCGVNYEHLPYLMPIPPVTRFVPPRYVFDLGEDMDPITGQLTIHYPATAYDDYYALCKPGGIVDQIAATNGIMYVVGHYASGGLTGQDFTNFLNYLDQKGVTTLTVNQAIDFKGTPTFPCPYNDGYTFNTQAELDAHILAVHSSQQIVFAGKTWTIQKGNWSVT